MSKRRGKRVVVGYVVSHTGKRGGPWEAPFGQPVGTPTRNLRAAFRTCDKAKADDVANEVRAHRPHARALPLVRYEVDAEEERLRDAVVEAADRWEERCDTSSLVHLGSAVRALRAHREKVAND